MNLRVFSCALLVAFQLMSLSGCYSRRYGAIAMVDDVGAGISTRYRYCLVSEDRKISPYAIASYSAYYGNDTLVSEFPHVFSEDGIKVVVRPGIRSSTSKYSWTQAFCAMSLTLFPECCRNEDVCPYEIEIAGDSDTNSRIEVIEFYEFSRSISPLAFAVFAGMPDSEGNRLYYTREHLVGEFYPSSYPHARSTLYKHAFAYAIAKRLKEMEDSGSVDTALRKMEEARPKAPPHRVERLSRDSEKDFAYDFALELESVPSNPNETVRAVIHDFAKAIVEDYADTFPHAKKDLLRVAFSGVSISGVKISGKASVLTIAPLSLSYDANTRRGKLSVRFNPGQADESRKWILANIATLARDKNILLTTGTLPPLGSFSICEEKVDGTALEIEFKTE